jgi:pimeloyl-ACP methyl ester carboxylesterase
LAGSAALGTIAATGAAVQRRHMRRIATDPAHELLESPPSGRPLKVISADGTALHAEVFGPERGSTIVLAHGWTETLSYWIYVIRELSQKGFRVVAYDLRGHGQSDPPESGDYSLERFGEDVEAVLAASVPERELAVIAGHSLGAMAIVAWAEHHDVESRVAAAALLNTGLGNLISDNLLLPWIAGVLKAPIARHAFLGARTPLPRVSTPFSHAAIRYFAFGPTATPAQVAFYERMLVACRPEARAACGIAMAEMDLLDAAVRLTVPTLVLAGASDRLTPPSHAHRIAEQLPKLARLIELPDTGHMGPLERPLEVSAALAELTTGVAFDRRVGAITR